MELFAVEVEDPMLLEEMDTSALDAGSTLAEDSGSV